MSFQPSPIFLTFGFKANSFWFPYVCPLYVCLYFCLADKIIYIPFWILHTSDIIRCLFFSSWFTSLCMTVARSIHISANGTSLFLFMDQWYSIVYMYHLFIHPSVDGHLGCFHVLASIDSATVNIGVYSLSVSPSVLKDRDMINTEEGH